MKSKKSLVINLDELCSAMEDSSYEHNYYLDLETGEMYCPWTNNIEIAPPLEGTPEAGLWSRLKRYLETVAARTR